MHNVWSGQEAIVPKESVSSELQRNEHISCRLKSLNSCILVVGDRQWNFYSGKNNNVTDNGSVGLDFIQKIAQNCERKSRENFEKVQIGGKEMVCV